MATKLELLNKLSNKIWFSQILSNNSRAEYNFIKQGLSHTKLRYFGGTYFHIPPTDRKSSYKVFVAHSPSIFNSKYFLQGAYF